MAGEKIVELPIVGHKGIVPARAACVVDRCVPGAHAGCSVPVLEGEVVLSWGRWRIKTVVH